MIRDFHQIRDFLDAQTSRQVLTSKLIFRPITLLPKAIGVCQLLLIFALVILEEVQLQALLLLQLKLLSIATKAGSAMVTVILKIIWLNVNGMVEIAVIIPIPVGMLFVETNVFVNLVRPLQQPLPLQPNL